MVESILPKEETIIDPLYEPLKLNRYELCPHLKMLSNVSHLRYGFSPYLLFDVEGWEEVVEIINRNKNGKKIYCTDFKTVLKDYLNKLERLPNVEQKDRNEFYKDLKEKRDKIKTKYRDIKSGYQEILNKFLYDGRTHDLNVKKENDKQNIYLKDSNKFKENFGQIAQLFQLEYPVKVKCPKCGEEQLMCEEGKIYSLKEALLRTFELRRSRWLQMSGSLHTIHQASTHTRLAHQIGSMVAGVNALREIDVYPRGNMLMSLGEYLLMRGELHEFLMANFLHDIGHSPLSHVLEPNPFIELNHEEITKNLIRGKKIEGVEGLDWYVAERYLLKMKAIKDFEHRFLENRYDPKYNVGEKKNWTDEKKLKDNFLDYLKENGEILESEVVTISEVLSNFGVDKDRVVEILSGAIFCSEKCGILLKIKDGKVKKCEKHGEAEVESEKIYDIQFLNKLIESEIDIDRMDHVKRDSVVCGLSLTSFRLLELLGSMSIVLPDSTAYTEIYKPERYLFSWNNIPGNDNKRLIRFLKNRFDIEWADKAKIEKIGDGKTIELSFENNFFHLKLIDEENNQILEIDDVRTGEFILKKEKDKLNIYVEINVPYILISENGLLYIMNLLNARKSVFNDILYSDANNWINGVVNQITALAVRSLPHIINMLPFITDQILMHFYTNDLFLGTQIEKLNILFHGKMDYSGYGNPMRYKLRDGMFVTEKKLKEIYERIEDINDKNEHLELPAVVFYMNIKPKSKKCGKNSCGGKLEDVGGGKYKCNLCPTEMNKKAKDLKKKIANENKKKRSWDDILVYGKKFVTKKGEKKYLRFTDLVKNENDEYKYENNSRKVFPTKPNELDVKNLLYVWISDFAACTENIGRKNSPKSKNEWKSYIKEMIGGVWVDDKIEKDKKIEKIAEFEIKFIDLDDIDLDDIEGVKKHE